MEVKTSFWEVFQKRGALGENYMENGSQNPLKMPGS